MIKYGKYEATIIDIDPRTEDIVISYKTSSGATVQETVSHDELEREKEVSDEFERLLLIHKCLGTIASSIKSTDGLMGSELAHVREILEAKRK